MNVQTHLKINQSLCGTPIELSEGSAKVSFTTSSLMGSDSYGLVHGGFLFGLADYAAMLAVNDPNVVLGSAESKFLKPVAVGETVIASAQIASESGKKRIVTVTIARDEDPVFTGTFTCFVLEKHLLEQ